MAEETKKDKDIVKTEEKAVVPFGEQGLEVNTLDDAWRFAQFLAGSQFVPTVFQSKPNDCLIAIDLAKRLRVAPLMLLQNSYIVHGKPGMEAKLVITLINQSGLFVDPLDYETVGDDAEDPNFKVRAFATRKSTGKVLYGPWITAKLVKANGWDKPNKAGPSKWVTIPDVMYHYRAASWFKNRHCPEVTMGMATIDELQEIDPTGLEGGRKSISSETIAGPTPTTGRTAFGKEAEPAKDVAEPKPDTTEDDGAKDGPGEEVEQKPLNKNIDPEGTPTQVCNDCGVLNAADANVCIGCKSTNIVLINAGPEDGAQKGGQS